MRRTVNRRTAPENGDDDDDDDDDDNDDAEQFVRQLKTEMYLRSYYASVQAAVITLCCKSLRERKYCY